MSDKQQYVLSNSESVQCNFFIFLITWRSSSSKSAPVYKISWKSDNFSLRYGDMSIFKMAAVRHLWIVLPPYETTHEVSCWPQRPVKFHVNLIHRSEDIASWIFRIFGLKFLLLLLLRTFVKRKIRINIPNALHTGPSPRSPQYRWTTTYFPSCWG